MFGMDISLFLKYVAGVLGLIYIVAAVCAKVRPKSIEVIFITKMVVLSSEFIIAFALTLLQHTVFGISLAVLSLFIFPISYIRRPLLITRREKGEEAYKEANQQICKECDRWI
jgi:hypothetical protein